MDGQVSMQEWVEFLTCTDEQLESDEWRSYKAIMGVRKRLATELVKRAVNTRSILVRLHPFLTSRQRYSYWLARRPCCVPAVPAVPAASTASRLTLSYNRHLQ
jgi:hypothetical protein|eukprot:COSAG06_NODE_3221_length_5659_cov_3.866547_3_plen_103_part_00